MQTVLRIADEYVLAYDEDMRTRVRQLRNLKGWSQQELANIAGVRQATISKIESKPEKTELETLSKVAAALGVRIGDLIDELPDSIDFKALAENFLRLSEADKKSITRQIDALAASQAP